MERLGLVCVNYGRATRFQGGLSCLDLTWVLGALACKAEWDVSGSYSVGSDHFPILNRWGGICCVRTLLELVLVRTLV